LEEVEPEIQKILVEKLGPERAAGVMQRMSVDELVDLIQLLPERESKEFMKELPQDTKKQHVKKILEYDEDEAGGLMTTEYLTAYPEDTVEQVIETIRRISHMHNSIYFIYIIDRSDKFLGVVSLRRLMLADNSKIMKDLMKNGKKIPTAKVDDELLELAALITKYNLYSAAVLNDKRQLLGIVTVDDIMRHFVPHA
jgi:magnesium transporter